MQFLSAGRHRSGSCAAGRAGRRPPRRRPRSPRRRATPAPRRVDGGSGALGGWLLVLACLGGRARRRAGRVARAARGGRRREAPRASRWRSRWRWPRPPRRRTAATPGRRRRLVQHRADPRARHASATRSCPASTSTTASSSPPGSGCASTLDAPDIDNADVTRLGVIVLSAQHPHADAVTDVNSSQPGGDNAAISASGGDETEPLAISSADRPGRPGRRHAAATWPGAGVYYLALHTAYSGDAARRRGRRSRSRSRPTIAGHGAAERDRRRRRPRRRPRATATATADAGAGRTPSDDGPPAALAAVGGVGGILIGVVAGHRPPPAPSLTGFEFLHKSSGAAGSPPYTGRSCRSPTASKRTSPPP